MQNISLGIEQLMPDSEEYLRFINRWADEIDEIFPDFSIHESTFATIFQLKVNNEPSGIFIYQDKGDELHIEVDYLVPKFRDQGIGIEFFNQKKADFKEDGFNTIVMTSENDVHQEYLKSLGFKPSRRHHTRFELDL